MVEMSGNIKKTNRAIAWLCGFFSTTPILEIAFGAHGITLFSACTFILLFISFPNIVIHKAYTYKKNGMCIYLILWFIWSILSSLVGVLYYMGKNIDTSRIKSYIPKIIIYLFLILAISSTKGLYKFVLDGLLYGAVANLVLASIDAIGYYLRGTSIVNTLFQGYIIRHNVRFGTLSLIIPNGIRSSGFNSDPAHIGMLAPFVFMYAVYTKKKILPLVVLGALLASMSTTAFVCCFIGGICMYIAVRHKKHCITSTIILFSLAAVSVVAFAIYRYRDVIIRAFNNFSSRINTAYIGGITTNPRSRYIVYFFDALIKQGYRLFTGTGYMTASGAYMGVSSSIEVDELFDIEIMYISYLFDLGVVGLFLLGFILIYLTRRQWKMLKKETTYNRSGVIALSGLISIILCNFFYHYTLYSIHMLILIAACIFQDEDRKLKYYEKNIISSSNL